MGRTTEIRERRRDSPAPTVTPTVSSIRALTIAPREPNSARLDRVGEPPASDGAVLVETLAVGICGTDREMVAGQYGWAPPGADRLIIGHESPRRLLQPPADS